MIDILHYIGIAIGLIGYATVGTIINTIIHYMIFQLPESDPNGIDLVWRIIVIIFWPVVLIVALCKFIYILIVYKIPEYTYDVIQRIEKKKKW